MAVIWHTTDVTDSPGRVIQRVREARGWNQETLGNKAGVDKNTVSRIEHDSNTTFEKLERVAHALDLSLHIRFVDERNRLPSHVETLDPDEWVLLSKFRALTQDKRQQALAFLDTLVQTVLRATRGDGPIAFGDNERRSGEDRRNR